MSRDPYYTGRGGGGGGGGGERWDTERFTVERDRNRFGGETTRERVEERVEERFLRSPDIGRARERSVDGIYERRSPRDVVEEEERYKSRRYYDEQQPRYERERERERGPSITIERERERDYYSPPSPRQPARPAFLRRQSSLDTFDRRPTTRFVEREEYGPPARYREDTYREELYREDARPPAFTPIPLPRTRALPPPRRFAERDFREYEEIKIAEPDFYGDDDYRGFPERVREREIIRRRRRSRSKEGKNHSVRGSVRSSSVSTSGSSEAETVRSEFPKKGKTRMPARLVSRKAIIDLGYPFEEEGDVIIIQKALGRENIDEVIKLSEDYKASENPPLVTTALTTYLVGADAAMSGGRSEGGSVIEERRTEVFTVPPPPPAPNNLEVVTDTKIVQFRSASPARSHHHHNPIIIEGGRPREESNFIETKREIYEQSDPIPIGLLALAAPPEHHRSRDDRAIRAEIRALEAEKEALRAEKRAEREMRKADRLRRGARASEGELVLYDRETFERPGEEVMLVRRERISEPEGGVRIEKDKKGRMSISVPKYVYE